MEIHLFLLILLMHSAASGTTGSLTQRLFSALEVKLSKRLSANARNTSLFRGITCPFLAWRGRLLRKDFYFFRLSKKGLFSEPSNVKQKILIKREVSQISQQKITKRDKSFRKAPPNDTLKWGIRKKVSKMKNYFIFILSVPEKILPL